MVVHGGEGHRNRNNSEDDDGFSGGVDGHRRIWVEQKKITSEPIIFFPVKRKSFRNVLQDEVGRLKVTDIGLSKTTHEKDVYGYKISGPCIKMKFFLLTFFFSDYLLPFVFLSVRYMDPEAYHRESYGKSVDVFLFALIVHEVSCIHFLLKRCIV
ncbi:putative protein kinase-like domain superfamily [Helianthus anomalus]